jgi:hypothetical protein
MKNLITILSLMVIVAISGCEKVPSIENLELGDTYENGIVVFVEPGDWVEIMSMEDIENVMSSEVPAEVLNFKNIHGDEWEIPTFRYAKHIIGVLNVSDEELHYWFQDAGQPLNLIPAYFGNNGVIATKPDDGNPHHLRMHRIVYMD